MADRGPVGNYFFCQYREAFMIYADAGVNGSRFESNQLYHVTHLKINSVFNSALLKDTLKAYFWYSNTFLRL